MAYEIAAHAGFCMGVRRAVEAALRVADEGKPSCTLGELIHNPEVVEMLRAAFLPSHRQSRRPADKCSSAATA